jgi:TPR repeat protein/WD40 repeat protein
VADDHAGVELVADLFRGLKTGLTGEKRRKPFKFLDPYGPEDAEIFFGRESEKAEIFARFYKGRLLVVYGESGSGKTSLIQCGLRTQIPAQDAHFFTIRSAMDPLEALRKEVLKETVFPGGEAPSNNLDLLREVIFLKSKPLALIFDQFEEFFIFQPESVRERFIEELASWLAEDINIQVVIGIREEYLAKLTEFEVLLPQLYRNRLWVRRMSRNQAQEVITEPCRACGVEIEKELTEELLEVLTRGGKGVELPILQVVLDTLYNKTIKTSPGSPALTLSSYLELGKIELILAHFIEDKVNTSKNPEQVRQVLKSMVTPEGTRRMGSRQEIAEYAAQFGAPISEEELTQVLDSLMDNRVIREDADNHLFELRHDALAQTICQWMTGLEQELMEVRQTLENRYKEYQVRGTLLDASILEDIAPYESRLTLKAELRELIQQSKKVSALRRRRRLTIAGCTIALVVGALILAFINFKDKVEQKRIANKSSIRDALSLAAQDPTGALIKSLDIARQSLSYFQRAILSDVAFSINSLLQQHRLKAQFGPARTMTTAAYAPDGSFIVSGDDAGTIYVWNRFGTLASKTFRGDEGQITALMVTPEGQIISASTHGVVRFWTKSGDPAREAITLTKRRNPSALAYNAAKGLLLVGDDSGWAHLLSMANTAQVLEWQAHAKAIRSIVWLGKNGIVTAGDDGAVTFWTDKGGKIFTLASQTAPVTVLAVSPDGSTMATGDRHGNLRFWNESGQPISDPIPTHAAEVTALAYDSNGQVLASGFKDGTIQLVTATGKLLKALSSAKRSPINALSFAPQGEDLLSAEDWQFQKPQTPKSATGTLKIWAAADGVVGLTLAAGVRPVGVSTMNGQPVVSWSTAKVTRDELVVSTLALDPPTKIWTTRLQVKSLGGNEPVLAVDPEHKRIAGGGAKGVLILWDAYGSVIKEINDAHAKQGISHLAFLAEGQRLLSVGYDGTLRLWTANGEPIGGLIKADDSSVYALGVSPRGDKFATAGQDRQVKLWDINGKPLGAPYTKHQDTVTAVAFHPEKDLIASGSRDGEIQLWSSNGVQSSPPLPLSEGITGLSFSADGSLLCVGTEGGNLHLYYADGLKPAAAPIPAHNGPVSRVFALPGTTWFVTFADEMKLWDADPQDWIKEACRRLRYLRAFDLREQPDVVNFCKDVLPAPSSLLEAVGAGDVDAARDFLKQGFPGKDREQDRQNLLRIAVRSGDVKMLSLLAHSGIGIDSRGAEGQTVLLEAAFAGRVDLVKVLVEAGANLNLQDRLGNTALIYAAMANQDKVAALLIAKHCSLDLKNTAGKTALQLALAMRHESLARMLAEAGAAGGESITTEFKASYQPIDPQFVPRDLHPLVREGLRHELGEGVPKSLEKACECFRQAALAGDAYAQFKLGRAYYFGAGVPRDCVQAVKWYRASASQGNSWGINNLATSYQYGEGVFRDQQEAVRLYQQAIDSGNAWSAYNLGWQYERGTGIQKSYEQAAYFYQRAMELGYISKPAYRLGSLYEYGLGVHYDPHKAAALYRSAVEAGLPEAMYNLGWLYESGNLGQLGNRDQKSIISAAQWYRRAAENGVAKAQTRLGWMYERGEGVNKSYEEAARWYQQAADQEDPEAMLSLGWLYESGQGVQHSPEKAASLYRQAADRGRPEAVRMLKRLENRQ